MPTLSIQYLLHSGYRIETPKFCFFIDPIEQAQHLHPNKKNFILISHGHGDHFDPKIFSWGAGATFVLSDDIASSQLPETAQTASIHWVHPNESLQIDSILIKTFASTDRGVSYWFSADQIHFLHTGDLNAWKWPNDPPATQKKEVDDYQRILQEIAINPVDIAFAPTDSRLKEHALLGAQLLLKTLQPRLFFPMHFYKESYTAEYAHALHRFCQQEGLPTACFSVEKPQQWLLQETSWPLNDKVVSLDGKVLL